MTVEELNVIITAQNDEFNRRLDEVNERLEDMENTAKSSSNGVLSSFKTLASGIAGLGIGKIISDSINSAMEAVESESLFETSLGEYADSAREWSEQLSQDLGLNDYTLRKNAATLYTMTKNMGIASGQALSMSEGLTELAEDMASFYNLSSDEAFAKIKSGLTGEAEPLKALGILVDDTTVKQYAYKTGIAEVGEELTQTQKVMARYQAILAQTSTAQGDLARTLDSPSNMLRQVQNEFNSLMITAGTTLLPTVKSVLTLASQGLEAISPMVTGLGEGINSVAQGLLNMTPQTKMLVTLSLAAAVAIPAVTKAQELYNLANAKWKSLLDVLIPKEASRANILKATAGWLSIIALLLAGVASIGATRREMDEDAQKDFEGSSEGAEDASESIADLAESYDELGNSADSAKKSLADVDTLNVISGSSAGTGGIDFSAISEGAENASDTMEELSDGIENMQEELNSFSLDGFANLFSDTFSDVGLGFSTIFDAFNFNSDTQLTSLRTLNQKVKDLFGEDWTDFWKNVGSIIYTAFEGNGIEQERALTEIQNWLQSIEDVFEKAPNPLQAAFVKWWDELWETVGNTIYKSQQIMEQLGASSPADLWIKFQTGEITFDDVKEIGRRSTYDQQFNTLGADINAAIVEYLKQGLSSDEALSNAKSDLLTSSEAIWYYENSGIAQDLSKVEEWRNNLIQSGQMYDYPDYSDLSYSLPSYTAAAQTTDLAKEFRSLDVSPKQEQTINLNATIELDGEKLGEYTTSYQAREQARSNGY